jgi:hypothetical protein
VKITVDLTDQELAGLDVLARGRQVQIVAGVIPSNPEDRAIAKLMLAARDAATPIGTTPSS